MVLFQTKNRTMTGVGPQVRGAHAQIKADFGHLGRAGALGNIPTCGPRR